MAGSSTRATEFPIHVNATRSKRCDTLDVYLEVRPWHRQGMSYDWLRATVDDQALVVYSFPPATAEDGLGYLYPGSTWVYRGPFPN